MSKGYLALKKYWEKHGWKPREIKYLKNNYKKKTDREMSEGFLSRHPKSGIEWKRKQLNLSRKEFQAPKGIWTEEETQILIDNYNDYTQRELANDFLPNKTVEQIRNKKVNLNLKKESVWTEEEIDKLIKVGGKFNSTFLAANHFPNKTSEQIRGKLKNLGISRRKIQEEQTRRKDKIARLKRRNERRRTYNKIIEQQKLGLKNHQISLRMGKSGSYVSSFLKNYNGS